MYPYHYPSYYAPKKPGSTMMPPVGPEPFQGTVPMEPPVPGTTSGMPAGPVAPPPPTVQPPPVDFTQEPGPPVTTDIDYTQAYLKTQIGKRVKIEFLIGTNMLTDRTGTLVEVGISYVLIRLQESDDLMLGDLYAIKFVTFYR